MLSKGLSLPPSLPSSLLSFLPRFLTVRIFAPLHLDRLFLFLCGQVEELGGCRPSVVDNGGRDAVVRDDEETHIFTSTEEEGEGGKRGEEREDERVEIGRGREGREEGGR